MRRSIRVINQEPRFQVEYSLIYKPAEPLSEDEWPDDLLSMYCCTLARFSRSPEVNCQIVPLPLWSERRKPTFRSSVHGKWLLKRQGANCGSNRRQFSGSSV